MLKCPYCNKEADIPPYAYGNADKYHNSVYVTTECCGNIVLLVPYRTYSIHTTEGKEEDDWGQPKTAKSTK
jgi:hypothetical protein